MTRFESCCGQQVVLEQLARFVGLGKGLNGQIGMGPLGHPLEEILQRIRQVRDVAALTHQRAVSGSVWIRMARWGRLFRACLACGQRGDDMQVLFAEYVSDDR